VITVRVDARDFSFALFSFALGGDVFRIDPKAAD